MRCVQSRQGASRSGRCWWPPPESPARHLAYRCRRSALSRDACLWQRPLSIAVIWPVWSIAHQRPGHLQLSGSVCIAGPASDPGAGTLHQDLVTFPWGRLGQEPVGALSAFPSGRLVLSVPSLPDFSQLWPRRGGGLRLPQGFGRSPRWPLPQTAQPCRELIRSSPGRPAVCLLSAACLLFLRWTMSKGCLSVPRPPTHGAVAGAQPSLPQPLCPAHVSSAQRVSPPAQPCALTPKPRPGLRDNGGGWSAEPPAPSISGRAGPPLPRPAGNSGHLHRPGHGFNPRGAHGPV